MGRGHRGSARTVWLEPEQVTVQRAARDFLEWWKPLLLGPLHRAGSLPEDLSIAAAEMVMSIAHARTGRDPGERLRCFRSARAHAGRCDVLLDAPAALELASAEALERGHELLHPVFALLERLIRPPPGTERARSRPGARDV